MRISLLRLLNYLFVAGHDTITVNAERLQGAKDPVLIGVCKSENRVLVTLDTDFADIRTYPPYEFSGIIVLKIGNQSKQHIQKVFYRILSLIDREPLTQHLWIVEETRIRIRGNDD